ncbi:MAG: S28 family serine protease [Bacteroidota bacterium]
MKKSILSALLIIVLFQFSIAQNDALETLLIELPDVVFKKIETAKNFESTYELRVKQPIDHLDTSKGYFQQRVFLSHRGFDQPTVMITEGYDRPKNRINELTDLIEGNQLLIEHRYFGKSVPDTLDYDYLTLKQVTNDLHRIKEIFKEIYPNKWLATGRSKGGATTLFYRYFYPKDVDVSVNYVGPINNAFEDQRIYTFLDTVGTRSCRSKIEKFQRYLLKNRKDILPLLRAYSLGANASYTYHSFEKAFEFAVMEYPFSFWQYGHNCDAIPNESVSYFEAVKYFTSVSNMTFFGDGPTKGYAPHYYQSATEFGYYGFETNKFKGLLTELPTDQNPHAAFTPNKMDVPFNGALLDGINKWLPVEGNKIIHIYGTLDTWSASAVPKSDQVDALWFFMEGKHHGNALIKTMSASEKEKLVVALERWLTIKIKDR